MILWIRSIRLKYKNRKTKSQPAPQTKADAPSGFTTQSFALSLIIFQMISSNLHLDPYTYNSCLSEKGFPISVFLFCRPDPYTYNSCLSEKGFPISVFLFCRPDPYTYNSCLSEKGFPILVFLFCLQ